MHRVTARSLTEALFSWRPEKIQYMRADTLAMLLTMANIGAHGKALVLDGCGGLVTGAVAERMGGFGQVKHCHRMIRICGNGMKLSHTVILHLGCGTRKGSLQARQRVDLRRQAIVTILWDARLSY